MKSKISQPEFKNEEFKTEFSLARELPYWDFIEKDDCIALIDGTLVQGFSLRGISIETWDEERINRATSGVRSLLNALPDGIELQLFFESRTNVGAQIDEHAKTSGGLPLIQWLSELRTNALRRDEQQGHLRREDLSLYIYSRLTPVKTGPLSFFSTPKQFESVKKDTHDRRLTELSQISATLCSHLSALGMKATPLPTRDIFSSIYTFLNPTRAGELSSPTFVLGNQSAREQLVFSDVVQGADSFFIDGFYHRVISLKTLPEFTHSALVCKLNSLSVPYTLSLQIRAPEQTQELSTLQAKRRMAHSMSLSQGGRANDLESEARLNSTEGLLRELLNTGQKIFYFQMSVLLKSETREELDLMTRSVLAKFRELNGAEALAEGIAGFKLFKTLLPAGNTTSVRAKRVKTDNLADFMPIYQQWEGRGKPVCVFRSRQGSLVSYDPFDPTIPNYNALVTGSAGAGKSFLNNCILLQYLSQNPLTYVIDIGGSYRKLCSFVDGVYITTEIPKNGESFRGINPFQLSAVETEPSPRKIKFLLSLMELILTDDEGEKLPKLEKALLEEAILTTYQICGKAGKTPRMTDLKVYMERSENARLLNFSKMLYPWTGDRPFGRMLDVEQGLDLKAEFVAFDLKGLSSYPDLQSVMLLIVTDFILGKIDEHPHKKKRIIMDECWELLKRKASSSFMEYCVRTLRKTGSGITFITQGLEEIQASDIGAAILNNTATKLILLQRGDLGPVKSILHLNEREMGLIRSLGQQKGVYSEAFLIADEDRGIIQVVPTPAEYWLATSDAADNRWINEVQTRFPDKRLSEVIHWLAEQFPQGSQGRPKIPEQILDKAFEGGKS